MDRHITRRKNSVLPRSLRSKVIDRDSSPQFAQREGVSASDDGQRKSDTRQETRTQRTLASADQGKPGMLIHKGKEGVGPDTIVDLSDMYQPGIAAKHHPAGSRSTSVTNATADDSEASSARSYRLARRRLADAVPVHADSAAPLVDLRAAGAGTDDARQCHQPPGVHPRSLLVLGPAGTNPVDRFGVNSPTAARDSPAMSRPGSAGSSGSAARSNRARQRAGAAASVGSDSPGQAPKAGLSGRKRSRGTTRQSTLEQFRPSSPATRRPSRAGASASSLGATHGTSSPAPDSAVSPQQSPSKRRRREAPASSSAGVESPDSTRVAEGGGSGRHRSRRNKHHTARMDSESEWKQAMRMATAAIEGPGHGRRRRTAAARGTGPTAAITGVQQHQQSYPLQGHSEMMRPPPSNAQGSTSTGEEGGSGTNSARELATPPASIKAPPQAAGAGTTSVDFQEFPSTPQAQTVSEAEAAKRGLYTPDRPFGASSGPATVAMRGHGHGARASGRMRTAAGSQKGSGKESQVGLQIRVKASPPHTVPGRAHVTSAGMPMSSGSISASRAASTTSGPICPLPSPTTAAAVMTPAAAESPLHANLRRGRASGEASQSAKGRSNTGGFSLARRESVASVLGSAAPEPLPASASQRAANQGGAATDGVESDASAGSHPADALTTRPMPTRPMRRHLASIQQATAESAEASLSTTGGASGISGSGAFASTVTSAASSRQVSGGGLVPQEGVSAGMRRLRASSETSGSLASSPQNGLNATDSPPVPAGVQVPPRGAAEGDVLAGSPGVSPVPGGRGLSARQRALLARAQRPSSVASRGSSGSPGVLSRASQEADKRPRGFTGSGSRPMDGSPVVAGAGVRSGSRPRLQRRIRRSLAAAQAAGSDADSDRDEEHAPASSDGLVSRRASASGGRGRGRGAPAARGLALAKLAVTGSASGDALAIAVNADRHGYGFYAQQPMEGVPAANASSSSSSSGGMSRTQQAKTRRGRLPAGPRTPSSQAARRLQALLQSGPPSSPAQKSASSAGEGGALGGQGDEVSARRRLLQPSDSRLEIDTAAPGATGRTGSSSRSEFVRRAARAHLQLPLPSCAGTIQNRGHALDAAITLLKQRRQLPTFEALRLAVESMLKSSFTQVYLRQLVGLVPWHYRLYREAASARGGMVQSVGERMDWKLCVDFGAANPHSKDAAASSPSDSPVRSTGQTRTVTTARGSNIVSSSRGSSPGASRATAAGSTSSGSARMGMQEVAERQQDRRDALLSLTATAHDEHVSAIEAGRRGHRTGKRTFDPIAMKKWADGFDPDSVDIPLGDLPVDPSRHRSQVGAQAVLANGTSAGMSPALYRSLSRDRSRGRLASSLQSRGTPSASPTARELRRDMSMSPSSRASQTDEGAMLLSRARRQLFRGESGGASQPSRRASSNARSASRQPVPESAEGSRDRGGRDVRHSMSPTSASRSGTGSLEQPSTGSGRMESVHLRQFETPPAAQRPTSSRMAPPPAPMRARRVPSEYSGTGRQTPPASSPIETFSNVRRTLDFGNEPANAAGGARATHRSSAGREDSTPEPARPSRSRPAGAGGGMGGALASSSDSPPARMPGSTVAAGLGRSVGVGLRGQGRTSGAVAYSASVPPSSPSSGLTGLSSSLIERVRQNAYSAARRREEREVQQRGRDGATVDLEQLAQGVQAAFQSHRRNVLSIDYLVRTIQHGPMGQGASAEELRTGVMAMSRIVTGWLSVVAGTGARRLRRSQAVSLASALDQIRQHESMARRYGRY